MKKSKLKFFVFKERNIFVSKAINLELASQGKSRQDAIKNLFEAYELLMEK